MRHRATAAAAYRSSLEPMGFGSPPPPSFENSSFVRYPVWVEDRASAVHALPHMPSPAPGSRRYSKRQFHPAPAIMSWERVPGLSWHLINLPTHPRVRPEDVEVITSPSSSEWRRKFRGYPAMRALSGKLAGDVVLRAEPCVDSPIESIPQPGERGQHSWVEYLAFDSLRTELLRVDNPTRMQFQEEQRRNPKSTRFSRNRFIHRNRHNIPRPRPSRGYPSNEALNIAGRFIRVTDDCWCNTGCQYRHVVADHPPHETGLVESPNGVTD